MNPKIKKREEIIKIAEQLKKEGKIIVTTNGAFDLLHYGHIKLFEYAKQQGDVLIVGLNSDESIKKYKTIFLKTEVRNSFFSSIHNLGLISSMRRRYHLLIHYMQSRDS